MSPFRVIGARRAACLAMIVAIILAGCGHEPVRRVSSADVSREAAAQPRADGEMAAAIAVQQIGVPYRYGGTTTSGFDCSGLAQYAYARAGIKIPRTTGEQWQSLAPIDEEDLVVGDILFFRIEGSISHVGLYLGGNRFVHAPSSGREVSVADLNAPFYARAFVRGGRPGY